MVQVGKGRRFETSWMEMGAPVSKQREQVTQWGGHSAAAAAASVDEGGLWLLGSLGVEVVAVAVAEVLLASVGAGVV